MIVNDFSAVRANGFFQGYVGITWFVVTLQVKVKLKILSLCRQKQLLFASIIQECVWVVIPNLLNSKNSRRCRGGSIFPTNTNYLKQQLFDSLWRIHQTLRVSGGPEGLSNLPFGEF